MYYDCDRLHPPYANRREYIVEGSVITELERIYKAIAGSAEDGSRSEEHDFHTSRLHDYLISYAVENDLFGLGLELVRLNDDVEGGLFSRYVTILGAVCELLPKKDVRSLRDKSKSEVIQNYIDGFVRDKYRRLSLYDEYIDLLSDYSDWRQEEQVKEEQEKAEEYEETFGKSIED